MLNSSRGSARLSNDPLWVLLYITLDFEKFSKKIFFSKFDTPPIPTLNPAKNLPYSLP